MPLAKEIRDIPADFNETMSLFEHRFPNGLDKSYMNFTANWYLQHMSLWRELQSTLDSSDQTEFKSLM